MSSGRHSGRAGWFARDVVELDLSVGHEQPRQVALYVCDWDHKRRAMRVTVTDYGTGKTLCSTDVANFDDGMYLLFRVQGDVTIALTKTAGEGDAGLQGVFLDPAPAK